MSFKLVFCLFYICSLNIQASLKMEKRMDNLYEEYQKVNSQPKVESYVNLHKAIEKFHSELGGLRNTKKYDHEYDSKYFQDRYKELGLSIGHYSGQIEYSGKFLFLAHKINPNSPYRAHTLYSEILGKLTSHGLGLMPNIQVAKAYEKEFPKGPYLDEVYSILGGFYKDIFLVLTQNRKDYKYDCYKKFITKGPRAEQVAKYKKLAISYYKKLKQINPKHADIKRNYISKINNNDREKMYEWSFCAD